MFKTYVINKGEYKYNYKRSLIMGEVTAEFKTATNREAAMVSAGEAMELSLRISIKI